MHWVVILVNFLLIEVAHIFASIGGPTKDDRLKYDLAVEDLNEFCPLAGFDEFDTRTDSRSNGKECYKYHWVPDPCTMEKSGRTESDLLHCGHYNMIKCEDDGDDRAGDMYDGLHGYDLPWEEVHDLCDVVNIKNRPPKNHHKKPRHMYWKWTFCENGNGTELRPCGHYSMEFYPTKEKNLGVA